MTYFLVDDQFPFHPKALAAGNAALGLWVRAGAWSKQYVTGGHIPKGIATSLGTKAEAEALVKAGLWVKVSDGYRFHDWQDVPGNLDADGEKKRRDSAREQARVRKQRQRSKQTPSHGDSHAESHAVTDTVTGHDVTAGVTPPVTGTSRTPSVHSPVNKTSSVRPVPERAESDGRTDDPDADHNTVRASIAGLGVDYDKTATAIGKACGRIASPSDVARIVTTILDRASSPPRSPTGFVITAITNDWPEFQKLIDTAEEAA
ncbi:hypothetical protein [Microcella alkaliphila]|uniref:Uncharacterized protein n=1 Tax=Microcella alkaliphila TaxID=279828 RepID=A0A0U5BPE9_9MICO|nr:hypothetical protein [Microcella alkaliphila]BAU32492.1 uncharacterized protein MalAC0309_1641 [Microcella alkaliphila]